MSQTKPTRNGRAARAAAPSQGDEELARLIPVARIRACPWQPRRSFDETKLAELTESVRSQGVLQPILVRPWPAGDASWRDGREDRRQPAYQLVAGERRWRAAIAAELKVIPARVLELDDRTALEVMVVENEQRDDLSALEKAAGYQALLDQGVGVDELAGRIGKSISSVRGALKLLQLDDDGREAVATGMITPSVGELIGRIPNAELRQKALCLILCPDEETLLELGANYGFIASLPDSEDPLPFRHAKRVVETCFVRELKQAPWSMKALDLVPEAGSCEHCPKRTGNNRAEYPGGRADVCTDPGCFARKLAAHELKVRQAHEAAGRANEVVSAKFPADSHGNGSDADWQKKKEARAAREAAADRLRAAVGRSCRDLLVPAAEALFAAPLGEGPLAALRLLVAGHARECSLGIQSVVLKARGEKSGHFQDKLNSIKRLITSLTAGQLHGLWAELVLARHLQEAGAAYHSPEATRQRNAFLLAFGIDWAAVEQAVKAEQKAKAKTKGKTKKTKAKSDPASEEGSQGPAPIDGTTLLLDLLVEADIRLAGQALETHFGGTADVQALLQAVPLPSRGESYTSNVYAALRRIAGLPSEAVTEIGDALVDAGLITGDGPKLPLAVGKCRVCGCTERDCRLCAERQGYECCWMDFDRQDLCSACAPLLEVEVCSILPHPIGKQLDDAGYMTVGSLYGKVPEEICGIAGLKPKSLLKALSVVEEWVRGQLTRTVEGDALPDMTGDLAPVEG